MTASPTDTLSAISLGSGILLVRDSDLFTRFAPYGFTLPEFRNWRRALGCPAMVMPNGEEFVDLHCFRLAIRLALRFGASDFKVGKSSTTPEEYAQNWRLVMADILASRNEDYAVNTEEVRAGLEKAANRCALFLAQFTGKAVSEAAAERSRIAATLRTPETVDAT